MPTPKIGEVDDLEVYLGQRGTGKSTEMCNRVLDLVRQWNGAYVIGHSLGRRLPAKLPAELGGEAIPITYHPTIEKLAKGLRRHPDRWHILAPPLELEVPADYYEGREIETADDLIRYAVRLSTALRMRAYRREHPMTFTRDPSKLDFQGIPSTPIVFLVDEGVAVEGAGAAKTKEQHRWFLQWIYSLRHLNIALLWSIQDPNARGWQVLGQATKLHVFHIKHQYAQNAIRAAGANEDELERIEALQRYQYVTIDVAAPRREDAKVPFDDSGGAAPKDAVG